MPGPDWGRASLNLRLLRGGAWGLDELRDIAFAAPHTLAVHRLELGLREGVGRRPRHQRVGPGLDPRVFLDEADRLYPVEEHVALQERRVGGGDQRVCR